MDSLDLKFSNRTPDAGESFEAVVRVPAVPEAATVTVTLRQTQGVGPFYTEEGQAVIDASGARRAAFKVQLAGKTGDTIFAVLLAEAKVQDGPSFEATAKALMVKG
ncbi:hypothetical protein WME99_36550 [Sorangium sp. So ce136]|uniref:hypothetical protein n=1 Tax=Sorangium sp. So ce136 TaxID=3133284 RepID=UPI003F043BBD